MLLKRFLKISVVSIVLIFTLSIIFSLSGCKEAAETESEVVVETVTETVIETVEVEKESPYTYEKLREMAEARSYEGEPAKDARLAYCDIYWGVPFTDAVIGGIKEEWALSGGLEDNLLILDNKSDAATAIENADIVYNWGPDVFIEFQPFASINANISRQAKEEGVFLIAVDIPVPGFPFMGVDNYAAGILAGEWAIEQIENVFGGWDNVDRVYYGTNPVAGETVMLRTQGSEDVLAEKYGDTARLDTEGTKAILFETVDNAEVAKTGMDSYLAKFPDDENILYFSVNEVSISGIQASAEAVGRWQPENWIIIGHGGDANGQQLVRDGIIDASIAYFPERYGRYLIPGALANIYGNPVPAYMYVENEVLTLDNIDDIYPQ